MWGDEEASTSLASSTKHKHFLRLNISILSRVSEQTVAVASPQVAPAQALHAGGRADRGRFDGSFFFFPGDTLSNV